MPFTRGHAHFLPAIVLAFVAWILLLLVTTSTPITKSIYIAQVDAHVKVGGIINVATVDSSVRFGVYGYCTSGIHATQFGGHFSQDEPAECSQKKLGYTFDSNVLDALHINSLDDDLSTTLTFGLSTHLVAAILSFITLLAAIASALTHRRVAAIVTVVFSVLAVIFALIAFIFDVVFSTVARHILHNVDNAISVRTGNGTWMTLAAMILLIIASVLSCIGFVRVGRPSTRPLSEKTERV